MKIFKVQATHPHPFFLRKKLRGPLFGRPRIYRKFSPCPRTVRIYIRGGAIKGLFGNLPMRPWARGHQTGRPRAPCKIPASLLFKKGSHWAVIVKKHTEKTVSWLKTARQTFLKTCVYLKECTEIPFFAGLFDDLWQHTPHSGFVFSWTSIWGDVLFS